MTTKTSNASSYKTAVNAVGGSVLSVGYTVSGVVHAILAHTMDSMADTMGDSLGVKHALSSSAKSSAHRCKMSITNAVLASAESEDSSTTQSNLLVNTVATGSKVLSSLVSVTGSLVLTDSICDMATYGKPEPTDAELVVEARAGAQLILERLQAANKSPEQVKQVLDELRHKDMERVRDTIAQLEGTDPLHYRIAVSYLQLVQNMNERIYRCTENMLFADSFDPAAPEGAVGGAGERAGLVASSVEFVSKLQDVPELVLDSEDAKQLSKFTSGIQKFTNAFVSGSNQYVRARCLLGAYKTYGNTEGSTLAIQEDVLPVTFEALCTELRELGKLRNSGRDMVWVAVADQLWRSVVDAVQVAQRGDQRLKAHHLAVASKGLQDAKEKLAAAKEAYVVADRKKAHFEDVAKDLNTGLTPFMLLIDDGKVKFDQFVAGVDNELENNVSEYQEGDLTLLESHMKEHGLPSDINIDDDTELGSMRPHTGDQRSHLQELKTAIKDREVFYRTETDINKVSLDKATADIAQAKTDKVQSEAKGENTEDVAAKLGQFQLPEGTGVTYDASGTVTAVYVPVQQDPVDTTLAVPIGRVLCKKDNYLAISRNDGFGFMYGTVSPGGEFTAVDYSTVVPDIDTARDAYTTDDLAKLETWRVEVEKANYELFREFKVYHFGSSTDPAPAKITDFQYYQSGDDNITGGQRIGSGDDTLEFADMAGSVYKFSVNTSHSTFNSLNAKALGTDPYVYLLDSSNTQIKFHTNYNYTISNVQYDQVGTTAFDGDDELAIILPLSLANGVVSVIDKADSSKTISVHGFRLVKDTDEKYVSNVTPDVVDVVNPWELHVKSLESEKKVAQQDHNKTKRAHEAYVAAGEFAEAATGRYEEEAERLRLLLDDATADLEAARSTQARADSNVTEAEAKLTKVTEVSKTADHLTNHVTELTSPSLTNYVFKTYFEPVENTLFLV